MTEPIEAGTRSSSLVQCRCGAILDIDVALTSTTPDVHLSAVVIAVMPCRCGKTSRALIKVGEQ